MLRNQEILPRLPIPPLNNLFEFINWIKPITDNQEFQTSQEALNQFLMPNGDGQKLQKKLIEISEKQNTSWLEPFWNDMYLSYREQLVCNMNYCAILDNTKLTSQHTVSTLGAKIIYEMMHAYLKVSSKSLSPEYVKDQPQCMDPYNHIFKSVRLPLLKKDSYKTYPFTKQNHIVVFYNNNIFKLETSDLDGKLISIDLLASKIQSIMDENIQDRGNDIGILTTANRDNASKLYRAIEKDKTNQNSLDIINTAVFVLCIDPATKDLKDLQKMILLSDGKNRYFDKNCQIIISKDLNIAFNNEHTGADAIPWFNVINEVFNKILKEQDKTIHVVETSLPEELKWNLSSDIKSRLKDQCNQHQKFVDNIFVDHVKFDDFGKNYIKNLKMSPDAFFHIALQIAQYKTFGKLRSTYESVSMRHFKNGRTECARPVNEHVSKFAIEVLSQNYSKERLKEFLMNAQNAHVDRIRKCQKGFGIERHLFVLYKIYEKYGKKLGIHNKPKLYDSSGYKLLTYNFMSTSGVGFENISLFGFGPVVEEGYGIGYVIHEERINVFLSTKTKNKDKGTELLNNLKYALLLLKDMASCKI
ncbi:choline/carnitine O-acyltransferase [Anaerophilus nitritogenes]|uniref:choline/carnitine O-acyltransferase n=1 Tax=Anaerophilus nitritogenes TaxID=2498136 RepID=UPI0013EA1CEB|nr:choline/carnitine O-acyltransferase [Anaerophilus nitritogenes]